MEWMNRGGRSDQTAQTQQPQTHAAPTTHHGGASYDKPAKFGRQNNSAVAKWGLLALLVSGAILVLATVSSIVMSGGSTGKSEAGLVSKDQLQAVFLNGGQVYFGDIDRLDSKSLKLSNIYYLRVNQQVQPNQSSGQTNANDISLVKLGCELHGPEDSMVINREQVIFWENLKADGQVAKAVEKYRAENPNGQNCSQQSNQSQSGNQNNSGTNQTTPNTDNSRTTP